MFRVLKIVVNVDLESEAVHEDAEHPGEPVVKRISGDDGTPAGKGDSVKSDCVSVAVRNFTTFAAMVHIGREHLIAVSDRVELLRGSLLGELRRSLAPASVHASTDRQDESGTIWIFLKSFSSPSRLHE